MKRSGFGLGAPQALRGCLFAAEEGQRGGVGPGAEDRERRPDRGRRRTAFSSSWMKSSPRQGPGDDRSEHRAPALADVDQLAGERIGGGQGGGAQEVEEGQAVGAEGGLLGEEVREPGHDLGIGGLLGERRVVEQLLERGERRVEVRHPEHDHLFEGGLAMGDARGRAAQVFGGADPALIDGQGRELLDEPEEGRCDRFRSDARRRASRGRRP